MEVELQERVAVSSFLTVTGSLSVSLSEESKCFGVLQRK